VRRGAGLLVAVLAAVAGGADAQQTPDTARTARLAVELRRDSAGTLLPPRIRATGLLADGVFEGALRNGFPVRLGFRLELWQGRFLVDRLVNDAAWDAVIVLDPVAGLYQLVRGGETVERFRDLGGLTSALAIPYTVDLRPPPDHGRATFYYVASLSVESLSVSDLEEVERWLRGDLGRAITRRGDVGGAFSRGARLALIRLSGLPHRSLEARTPSFR
jgi:hypothetical protein